MVNSHAWRYVRGSVSGDFHVSLRKGRKRERIRTGKKGGRDREEAAAHLLPVRRCE